jgi:hypothetical protein
MIYHEKSSLRVKLLYYLNSYTAQYSSSDTWQTSNFYSDEWVLIICEINQNIIKIKKNNAVILEYSQSTDFIDGSDVVERHIHIGTNYVPSTGLGGFVWYAGIYSQVNIESQFLGTSSNNCFVGTCGICNPSFVIPSLGTGCAANVVSTSSDSDGNPCLEGYGCKGALTMNCNCESLSCEFISDDECYCIESTNGSKDQMACKCLTLTGQGCCHVDCESCVYEDQCLTCVSDFSYVLNGKCFCDDGYYKDPSSISINCLKCNSECKTCSSELSCTSCTESVAIVINFRCYCPESISN